MTKILRGVADASGKDTTATDKVLTVNGCLATDDQWREFDLEWQAYLKDRGFKRDPRTHKYVFHASDFLANRYRLGPTGLTFLERQRLYRHLIGIICKHTAFRFGWGVSLVDFRRYEADWPDIRQLFGQPGSYVSKRCFDLNELWAHQNGFQPKIDYIFDRGDEFWGEMFANYREVLEQRPEELQIGQLDCGNKADYSPIQAADIVALECNRYFRNLSQYHLSGVHTALPKPGKELNMLAGTEPGKADFRFKAYQHPDDERKLFFKELLESTQARLTQPLVGKDSVFPTDDDFAKCILDLARTEMESKKGNKKKIN